MSPTPRPVPTRRRLAPAWCRAAATIALVVSLAGACSGDDDRGGAPSTTTATATTWPSLAGPAALPSPTVDPTPRWTAADLGLVDARDLTFVGDLAVVAGTDRPGTTDTTLVVVDAATGAERWRLDSLSPLPDGSGTLWLPGVDGGLWVSSGAAVVVTRAADRDGWGIAALGLDDGAVRWHHGLVPVADDAPPSIVGADDAGVLVRALVPPHDGSGDTDEDPEWSTVLLGGDGTPRWTAVGARPQVLAPDLVVVDGAATAAAGGARIEALARADGTSRWHLDDDAEPVAATGSGATILTWGGGERGFEVLDGADGSVEAAFGPEVIGCRAGTDLVACTTVVGRDLHVVTHLAGETTPRTSGRAVDDRGEVGLAPGDAIVVGSALVDRSGNPLGAGLPGPAAAFGDGVVAVFDTPSTLAVHGLT